MSQNPDQLSRLLLEADGLLLLLHRHRDETPIDAIKLLRKKLELILALTDGFDECDSTDSSYDDETIMNSANADSNEPNSNDTINASCEHHAPTLIGNDEPIFINSDTQPVFYNDNSVEISNDNNVDYRITDIVESESSITESYPTDINQSETSVQPDNILTYEVLNEDNTPAETDDTIPVYRHTYIVEDDENSQPESNKAREAVSSRKSISSVFNLNDKFRFRRELFGNSDAQYVECLDLLSAMSSLDEAKEYLFDDLTWDIENEDVKAFIELISNYYNT